MLLIMISLKQKNPQLITSALHEELHYLNPSSGMPKEKELLIRLFISFLPPTSVLEEVRQESLSSLSYIHGLNFLDSNDLIEKYICVDHGLLETRSPSLLKAIVDLIKNLSVKLEPFQNRWLIDTLFMEIEKNEEGVLMTLDLIGFLLSTTFYIIGPKQINHLQQLYSKENFKEKVATIMYNSVLRGISDVKYVNNAFLGLDVSR